MPTTSSVSPGAFSTTCPRYLPMPSCVIPRLTVTPVFLTSANLIVSFGCAQIERGLGGRGFVRRGIQRGDGLGHRRGRRRAGAVGRRAAVTGRRSPVDGRRSPGTGHRRPSTGDQIGRD